MSATFAYRPVLGIGLKISSMPHDAAAVESAWTSNWTWGLPLTALTVAIHVTSIVGIGLLLIRARRRMSNGVRGRVSMATFAIVMIGATGWMLAVLHGLEAAIWAGAYLFLGAFQSPADAVLYSLDSMTTRGAAELALPEHWRLMGALESVNGMLLFGISTAFLFAVIGEFWDALRRIARDGPRPSDDRSFSIKRTRNRP